MIKRRDFLKGVGLGSASLALAGCVSASKLFEGKDRPNTVSYTHLRAHETRHDLVCRLLLEKKNKSSRSFPLV